MEKWKYAGLNDLDTSLRATGVLSQEYRSLVFGFVLCAIGEAYRQGKEDGEKKKEDK